MAARRSARRRLPPLRQAALTTTQRGYGQAHQLRRREVNRVVDAGTAICWRCAQPIHPAEPWDLGHTDHPLAKEFGMYRGPEHRACYRSARAWKRQERIGVPPPPARRRNQPPAKALRWFDTVGGELAARRIKRPPAGMMRPGGIMGEG